MPRKSSGEKSVEGSASSVSLTDVPLESCKAEEDATSELSDSEGCVSVEFRKEEARLRRERETLEATEATKQAEVASILNEPSFEKLNTILDKTGLFTKILREQIEKMEEEQMGLVEDDEDDETKNGGKRSRSTVRAISKKQRKTRTPTQELLPLIEGELRPYQLKGVFWLISLYQNGINGILADEMGLGKTIQTIGFLSHLRHNGILGPFMVVAPLSTIGNWVMEFKKWAPSLPAIMYHGTKDERNVLKARLSGPITADFPTIVTTYEITMNDLNFLKRFDFKSLVIDEGHRLKNFKCKLLRCLREIKAESKVLLTGTPLQNSLSELWSVLNFILPDIFTRLDTFEQWFDFSGVDRLQGQQAIVAAEQRDRVVSKLHSILRPFFLRRLKADVDLELPAKQEIVLYAHMTPYQVKINEGLLDKSLIVRLEEGLRLNNVVGLTKGKLRHICMQMRKNCNHPDLITGGYDGEIEYPPSSLLLEQCGKLHLLDRVLQRLKERGHKVLIFSQMKRMLDILDYYLAEKGEDPCRLDGSVKLAERQENMQRFNTDSNLWLFLLTTRAGGLGINLTAADTVIIYDSDWNPQQDFQAMDRCHRIGQSRPVLVFRLVTAQSVEGRMIRRAANKVVLERIVMKKGAFQGDHLKSDAADMSMSVEEILPLLKSDVSLEDEIQREVVSDEMLDQLLNREHLMNKETSVKLPYPPQGPGLCGDDERSIQTATQICLSSHSTEDEVTSTAKGFSRLFAHLGLEHVTTENILGTSHQCNAFIESVIDIIEAMERAPGNEKNDGSKRGALPSGLEGFMSNIALLDAACSKMKDLLKIDMDLFPANLKQEGILFREELDKHIHCVFTEVLSLRDNIKTQFRQWKISPTDSKEILNRLRPSTINAPLHEEALQQLSSVFTDFNTKVREFVHTFPTCIRAESKTLQGIGQQSLSILHSYRQLTHLMDLMKRIHSTKKAITSQTQMDALSDVKKVLSRLEHQTEPFLRQKTRHV